MRRTGEAIRESGYPIPWAEQARLNAHGELEPKAVDESLTSLLFAARPAKMGPLGTGRSVGQPTPADAPSVAIRSTVTLFEMV